jgi:hypothetical protein
MNLRWRNGDVREQHLEGECRDIAKLTVELYEGQPELRPLKVHHVESVSDGTLRIYLDVSREGT